MLDWRKALPSGANLPDNRLDQHGGYAQYRHHVTPAHARSGRVQYHSGRAWTWSQAWLAAGPAKAHLSPSALS